MVIVEKVRLFVHNVPLPGYDPQKQPDSQQVQSYDDVGDGRREIVCQFFLVHLASFGTAKILLFADTRKHGCIFTNNGCRTSGVRQPLRI